MITVIVVFLELGTNISNLLCSLLLPRSQVTVISLKTNSHYVWVLSLLSTSRSLIAYKCSNLLLANLAVFGVVCSFHVPRNSLYSEFR